MTQISRLPGFADPMSVNRIGRHVHFAVVAPPKNSVRRHEWDEGISTILSSTCRLAGSNQSVPVDLARTEVRVVADLDSVDLRTRMGLLVNPERLADRLTSLDSLILVDLVVVCAPPMMCWGLKKMYSVYTFSVKVLRWEGSLRSRNHGWNSSYDIGPEFDEWGQIPLAQFLCFTL
ncbi:hypothetical protein D9756_011415 [Leucocoprinus leucothites]|uniref:Uncharacterized protein n=1 Tax=Leucocoprinus leucothites TaxID=201217 RepID=A0A8H5FPW9_9AGAR|nr:hypothetical protein D9756_011415 [Leucoagaricus leucothites]